MADELVVQKPNLDAQLAKEILFQVVTGGDTSAMTVDQKLEYYRVMCNKVDIDPALTPFIFIKTKNGERLYASKSLTNQLGMKKMVSCTNTKQEMISGIFVANYRATTPDGRVTDEVGAVSVDGIVKDDLANCIMKAHSKAKRRAVLSHCGLGMLSEDETDTMGGAQATYVPPLAPPAAPSALEQARAATQQLPAAPAQVAQLPTVEVKPAGESETKKRGAKKKEEAAPAPAPSPAPAPKPQLSVAAPAPQPVEQPVAPPPQPTGSKPKRLSDHLNDICSAVGCSQNNGLSFLQEVCGSSDLAKADPIVIRAILFTLQEWVKTEDRKNLAALICSGKGLNGKPQWMEPPQWGEYVGKFVSAMTAKKEELEKQRAGK